MLSEREAVLDDFSERMIKTTKEFLEREQDKERKGYELISDAIPKIKFLSEEIERIEKMRADLRDQPPREEKDNE